MLRLGRVILALALLTAGCKKAEGGACDVVDDCRKGLDCVTWEAVHEEVLGDCDATKCCAGKQQLERVYDKLAHSRALAHKKKQTECGRLKHAIKKGRGKLVRGLMGDTKERAKVAATADAFAESLARFPLTDEALLRLRDDYAAVVKDTAQAIRDTDKATDDAETLKAPSSWGRLAPRKTAIMAALKKYCAE